MGTHPKLEPFITAILTQIFCYLTKLGWWEDLEFRKISSDLFNRHRKTNIDFRDYELFRSCEIAFATVRDLVQNPAHYDTGLFSHHLI